MKDALPTRHTYASYGSLGFSLAALALPVYVYVPKFYADQFGLPLGWIGLALLLTRLLDALLDPVIGVYVDQRFRWATQGQGQANGVFPMICWAALPLMVGFVALFIPPAFVDSPQRAWVWLIGCLLLTYPAYGVVSIAYQTWGAVLGNLAHSSKQEQVRLRWVAYREAAGLMGVILAASVPAVWGMPALVIVFVLSLLLALCWQAKQANALRVGSSNDNTQPNITAHNSDGVWRVLRRDVLQIFRGSHFRWLFGVYMVNGVAASIPATLFLFFVQDALGLSKYGGLYLVLYFLAAALALPLWVRCADQIGEVRAWALGMFLAILAFVWAYGLPHSQHVVLGYALVCFLSGMALGADLVLPSALLAALLNHRHQGTVVQSGTAFGLWSGVSKLNLALAAGLILPALQWLGYHSQPEGALEPLASNAPSFLVLVQAYALWPCVLKMLALMLLWVSPLRHLNVPNKQLNQGVTHED